MAFFLKYIRYLLLILFDRQTPWYAKTLVVTGVVYIFYPFDLVTDLIPWLGWLDDLTVGSLLLTLAVNLVPSEVKRRIQRKINSR
jgi:uncharacterized membrane protein YkvA (DUF1232 family)